jgi:hypothetical protein
MESKTGMNGEFRWMRWLLGSISVLLLMAAGRLAVFAQPPPWEANVTKILLALYLAFWSYVLGIVGLVLLAVWWFVGRRMQTNRADMSRYSRAKSRHRGRIHPVLEPQQFREQGAATGDPIPLTVTARNGNKIDNLTRVP